MTTFCMRAGLLGLALGMAGALGLAQAKRPMTFSDLMAIKRVGDPQVSADGKWVMFSVVDVSLAANTKTNRLWVVPVAGGAERDLGLPAGAGGGRFSPDGHWLSYSNAGQIWLAPWDEAAGTAGAGKQLTSISTGADGAVWSPDSKRLLFVSSVYPECPDDACNKAKDEAAAQSKAKGMVFDHLLYRHWTAFTGEKRSHVFVVSAADGLAVRDLTPRSAVGDAETPTLSLGGPLGYAWAPDSKEIAYVTNLDAVKAASTNNDVFTLRLDDAAAEAVKVSTSPGSDDGPNYSPDGKWLAFRSQARPGFESDRFRLMVMDRGTKATREALSNFDFWVDEFTWAPGSKAIYFASGQSGEAAVMKTALSGAEAGEALNVLVGGEFGDMRIAPDGKTIVASRMTAASPANLVTGDLTAAAGAGIALTHENDILLNGLDLSKLESFRFTGAENTTVQGFVVRPPNFDPARKYPVKFLIHGGPQGAWGDAWSYRWNPELMAAGGYVVVMVNPRGSTGYGQKFIDEVSGDWGGRAYIDLMKGLDAAAAKFPFIDKTRECALGASYGGYMANWILTHTDRFKCIVTHDGMYNPASAYGDTEELWFNEWEFRRPEDFASAANPGKPAQPWRYAAGPEADDPFRKWSPMLHIQDAKTPTLVIHSQLDYRLDVSEGYQLFTALQRLGVPSKMLYFPDEGHWILKPQNSQLWNETVGKWCDRWTKSEAYAGK